MFYDEDYDCYSIVYYYINFMPLKRLYTVQSSLIGLPWYLREGKNWRRVKSGFAVDRGSVYLSLSIKA